jgi:hypothetical protein
MFCDLLLSQPLDLAEFLKLAWVIVSEVHDGGNYINCE